MSDTPRPDHKLSANYSPREKSLMRSIAGLLFLILFLGVSQAKAQSHPGVTGGEEKKTEEIVKLGQQSYKLLEEGKYDEALPAAEKVLALAEKSLGPEDIITASALDLLARVYEGKKDYQRAESFFLRAVKIAELWPEDKVSTSPLLGLANLYYETKSNEKAELLCLRLLPKLERLYGGEDLMVAEALFRLSEIYGEKGNYDQAEVYAERVLRLREKLLGPNHSRVAAALYSLAQISFYKGDYDRADSLLARAFTILENSAEDRGIAVGLASLFSEKYLDLERPEYQRAERLYQRGLEFARKFKLPDYPKVALLFAGLAELYEKREDYERASEYYQRTVSIVEKAKDAKPDELVFYLNKLALVAEQKGESERAESLYRRALSLAEEKYGAEDRNLLTSLWNLGWMYLKKGEYDKAEPPLSRNKAIAEKVYGVAHPLVATSNNSLGYLYERKRDLPRAEIHYRSAIAIAEKAGEAGESNLPLFLQNLAGVYSERGDFEGAEKLYQRALSLREKKIDSRPLEVAFALDWLGSLFNRQADYGRAEPFFSRALAIREGTLGAEHPDTANSLDRLADIYDMIGDHKKAEQLYQRVLAIREKTLGPDAREVARALNSLASLYRETERYGEAEKLLKRSLSIAEKRVNDDPSGVGWALSELALIYKAEGDFARAEPLYQRAIKLDEKAYGPDSSSVSSDLHNLALLYTAQGDFAWAEALFNRSLAIDEKAKGSTHPDVAETLLGMAYFYGAKGEPAKAVEALTRGTQITERSIGLILATAAGTEEQKRAYMEVSTIAYETNGAVSLHMQFAPDDKAAARLALTTILRRKGRVLDAVSNSVQSLRRRLGTKDRELLDQLAGIRSQLATKVLDGPGNADARQHQAEISKLEEQASAIEQAVSRQSSDSGVVLHPVTIEQIQKAIPEGATLVEFVAYRSFNPKYRKDSEMWKPWRYAGYLLRREGEPLWADLGETAAIDVDIVRLRTALRNPRSANVKELARSLDEKLMRPVRKLLGGSQTVLLSPDGMLNLLPFGALVDESGKYLVENYSFIYLTSGRDLLRQEQPPDSAKQSVIIANPLFEQGSSAGGEPVKLAEGSRASDLSKARFPPLPGTAEEAEALKSILPGASVLTGPRATETALKKVQHPQVLHIATHGFFLPDQMSETNSRGAGGTRQLVMEEGSDREKTPQNPLLRSGLALAGANQRQGGEGENGILTALEAAGLDLWGTKLVVLSACETGVGEVKSGEGIYGLRRALVTAGAESQVMSLWQVSDHATRDLMIGYYKRLRAGEGRNEALRHVQLAMLGSKDLSHPYYWAAFIQSGAWTGLNSRLD